MSQQPNIRWRESDNKELRRVVKNYNAKISREYKKLIAQEKRYDAANLPKKVSVKELKENIQTRKDFNKTLGDLRNFSKTGEKFVIDKVTQKSLTATVRDFNKKVDRLVADARKKGKPLSPYPDKISETDLKKLSRDKDNLTRLIKEHKEFLKRGSEQLVELPGTNLNVKLTKWQHKFMTEGIAEVNARRAQEREDWANTAVKYGGKPAGYTRGEIGMDMGGTLPDMNLYTKWTEPHDLKYKMRLIIKERQEGYWNARTELAKINYLETVKSALGNDPVGKLIIKKIEGMPIEDFKRTLTSDDDLFDLLYRIKMEKDESMRTQLLNTVWNEWYPGTDMDTEIDKYINKKASKL